MHRWIDILWFPPCISKSLWLVELHLKVEIYLRDVRMWTKWFQTKKHFVLKKNVKPHWTVLYKVTREWKSLRHLQELRPKTKEKCCPAKDGNEWWGSGWLLPGRVPFRLASCSIKNFAMKLKGLLILHDKDYWESFQISIKLFPKCILIWLARSGSQWL